MSMGANSWWASFFNCDMVVSTLDACPFFLLFSIIVTRVRVLVLLADGVSAFWVRDLVLFSGDVVFIIGVCLFFLCLCLAIVDCSSLGTSGVDIVGNC